MGNTVSFVKIEAVTVRIFIDVQWNHGHLRSETDGRLHGRFSNSWPLSGAPCDEGHDSSGDAWRGRSSQTYLRGPGCLGFSLKCRCSGVQGL